MTMTTKILALTLVLAFCVIPVGCDKSMVNRHTGEHGYLVFEYESAKDPHNFNKPIFEGALLELEVTDVPAGLPVQITTVRALTPQTGRVAKQKGNRFAVDALSVGWALFEVHGRDKEGRLRIDTIRLRVDRVETLRFHPRKARVFAESSGDDPETTTVQRIEVPAGSRVEIPWTRLSAKQEPLIGYGVFPIAIKPPGAARIDESVRAQDHFTLVIADESIPFEFEVVPAAGLRGDRLIIEVVKPRASKRVLRHFPKLSEHPLRTLMKRIGADSHGVRHCGEAADRNSYQPLRDGHEIIDDRDAHSVRHEAHHQLPACGLHPHRPGNAVGVEHLLRAHPMGLAFRGDHQSLPLQIFRLQINPLGQWMIFGKNDPLSHVAQGVKLEPFLRLEHADGEVSTGFENGRGGLRCVHRQEP